MSKALVTFAVGAHIQLLDIARPSYQAWAKRHGWEYIEPVPFLTKRPPAWYKIPLMRWALEDFDEVLFIGADLVIVDGREDISVPPEYWQAMVRHTTGDGDVPNDDFWFVRRPMKPILDKIWTMTQWVNHGWWEQAALLDLMGYHVIQPTHLIEPTKLYNKTYWLDPEWNVHRWHRPQPDNPKIQHATMWQDRGEIMRKWAEQAKGWME
jgi:hypothetical protein